MAEAVEFIKAKLKTTSKHITQKMHAIINQYFNFKKDIQSHVDRSDNLEIKYKETMLAYTQQAPCFEATFAINARSVLRLYDCIVPQVKQLGIRCTRCKDEREQAGIHDPPMTDEEVQSYLGFWQKSETENANKEYVREIKQLKNELELVDYYTEYMEKGLCSKELMRRHMVLEKQHQRLKKYYKIKMTEFTDTIWELRQQVKSMSGQLAKQ